MTFLVACTPIYDAEYDDRAAELEAFRTEFLPADANTKLIAGAQDKLFWVDVTKPLDRAVLHSFAPGTNTKLDYAWSADPTELFAGQAQDLREAWLFGSSLVVRCDFGTVRAYDATTPDGGLIAEQNQGFQCAIDGDTIYYLVGRDMMKWAPRAGAPQLLLNLDTAGVGDGQIGAVGVIGDLALVEEGGDLWTIDLVTKQGTWLENEDPVTGSGFFDERGVIYETQQDVKYTLYADHSTFSFQDAVNDGGYHLNYKHGDVDEVADDPEMVIDGTHVVYRSVHGIFAYGLDTKKTVDLLLDGRFDDTSFEIDPRYAHPVVTVDSTLFVMNDNGISSGGKTVYRVDLAGRLR